MAAEWIRAYRAEHGITGRELALVAGVSEALIAILERQDKAVTHPLLANRIATICGATAEQRDGIVHKRHRGTWQPPRRRRNGTAWAPAAGSGRDRAIVAVNREGKVLARYANVKEAAESEEMTSSGILWRCRRNSQKEWLRGDITYRFADEWLVMTPVQRANDLAHRGGKWPGEG